MQSADERPSQFDIWSSIQSQKAAEPAPPYVPPLFRRSSSSMSRESLEICTESLGSETGSDEFFSSSAADDDELDDEEEEEVMIGVGEKRGVVGGALLRREGKELMAVNYHCAIGRRPPPARSFPPPLTSIARRDTPRIHLRSHRRDGRLVVEAVAAPPLNYLHARRVDGRLVLSFIDAVATASDSAGATQEINSKQLEEESRYEEEEEEDEEEEVEVVDRGAVIEVKVQQQSGAAAAKVHRSSLVINKFVGVAPLNGTPQCRQAAERDEATDWAPAVLSRASLTAAAASTLGGATEGYNGLWTAAAAADSKQLFFTSKRRNREELLHSMRRCSLHRRPLFIWEPCCIATSS